VRSDVSTYNFAVELAGVVLWCDSIISLVNPGESRSCAGSHVNAKFFVLQIKSVVK
jgi:hypothetical protein